MEEYKSYKRDFSRLGLRFILGTLVIYGVQVLVQAAVSLLRPEWLNNANISLLLSIIPMYLIGMPVLIAMVWRLPGTAPEKHPVKPGQLALAFIMCYAVLYLSNVLGTIITTIVGIFKGSAVNNNIMDIATSANMGLTFLFMVICAPIMEEFIFRKLIVDRTLRYGQGAAILLSGLMFGLFHGNLSQFAYAFTLGMFLAFLYVKTGMLKITIAMHMCINFMGGIVSVLLLKATHLDELLTTTQEVSDPLAMTDLVMEHLGAWMLYMLYVLFILGMVIAGIVLFIVFRKRFALQQGEILLPKGKRFNIMFLNVGMILYSLFWIVMIIIQLFWG